MSINPEILKIAAYVGAGISVGLASVSAGVGEGYTAGHATHSLMRQPKAGDDLLRTMLVSQAITETGAIFALVVSFLLIFGGTFGQDVNWYRFAALLSAGLAMGIGSIGPGFGSGYAGGQALKAIGRMPKHTNEITGNMLIGQALAQTDAIFSLVIALLLLFSTPALASGITIWKEILHGCALIGAGLAIGIGTFGPGIAIGFVAGRTNEMIGRFPRQRGLLTRTMFLGAAVSESTAIYALVISLLLMFAL